MTAASLQSFRQTVTVSWPAHARDNGKALLLRMARAGHARIMADGKSKTGSEPQWDAYANRVGNTNLDSVVVPGPIVYRYRYTRKIVEDTLDALRKASPVRSGNYVRSHTLYINGAAVDKPPVNLKASDEIMIANPLPYARRIEIGKTEKGRDFVIQVENKIYERTAKAIAGKYRSVAKVTFAYITPPSGDRYVAKGKAGKGRRGRAGTVTVPAIIIELKT